VSRGRLAGCLVALAIAAAPAPAPQAAPKGKPKKLDLIWVHPAFDSLAPASIGLLPAASFDSHRQNEMVVERVFGQVLQPTGYRWVSAGLAKEMIRAALTDSALAATRQAVLTTARVDSLAAPRLCRALRVGAVLSVRLDLFEQVQVEWNQSGKPSTTITLRAAVVDSGGRQLWMATGSETGEGPYHEADAGTLGVKGSGLGATPITGQGGAPSYEEVATRLLSRWMPRFPARRAATPATP